MVALQLDRLSVGYGGRAVVAEISAELEAGRISVLIGPNGSGKSTLLRGLAGLLPTGGRMVLAGGGSVTASYMAQDTSASSSLSLLEVVLLGRVERLGLRLQPQTLAEAEAALARFDLADLQGRRLDQISGGQRQLVFLAQALFRRSKLLLLDEPTAALDLRHQLLVMEALAALARREELLVLIAMHDLNLASRLADQLLCLHEGKLAAVGRSEAVLTPDLLRAVYGIEAEIDRSAGGQLRVTPLGTATCPQQPVAV